MLRDALAGHPLYRRVVVADSLTSTNDEARRLAAGGAGEGTVVLANAQSAGRGRLGRSFYSPPHLNLYSSILLRPTSSIADTPTLILGAAVAVAETVAQHSGTRMQSRSSGRMTSSSGAARPRAS